MRLLIYKFFLKTVRFINSLILCIRFGIVESSRRFCFYYLSTWTLCAETEVREATEDPRPIREYAWVPVIRLHLNTLWRERRRVSPCRWHVLNGMRCSETASCDVAEAEKMQMQSLRRRINDDVNIFESQIADITRVKKFTINSPRHREVISFCCSLFLFN